MWLQFMPEPQAASAPEDNDSNYYMPYAVPNSTGDKVYFGDEGQDAVYGSQPHKQVAPRPAAPSQYVPQQPQYQYVDPSQQYAPQPQQQAVPQPKEDEGLQMPYYYY